MSSTDQFDHAVSCHIARTSHSFGASSAKVSTSTEPRTVDLHFWAPDEVAARQLAASLVEFGATNVHFNQTSTDDQPSEYQIWGTGSEAPAGFVLLDRRTGDIFIHVAQL